MAPRYLYPQYEHIIEPFAGAAGYSLYYHKPDRPVTLIDIDPKVAGVWQFLIRSSFDDIMALPLVQSVDELPGTVCQEARWLIGFCMDTGTQAPNRNMCNWGKQPESAKFFWGKAKRATIANQVRWIKHWKFIHGSYEQAPNVKAHWYVDPPYAVKGKTYRYSDVDYQALAKWCLTRKGYVQVCENEGATWMPFEFLSKLHSKAGSRTGWTTEVTFENGNDNTALRIYAKESKNGNRTATAGNDQGKADQKERVPARLLEAAGQGRRRAGRRQLGPA